MNNAEIFAQTFGIYATEMWAMPESKFLSWLNSLHDVNAINTTDTINRQDVLKLIRTLPSEEGMTKGLLETSVKQLPSAERKGEWIPCSERLPEERSRYLVTVNWRDHVYVDIDDYYCYGWDDYKDAVLAWCELPEPWRGDTE